MSLGLAGTDKRVLIPGFTFVFGFTLVLSKVRLSRTPKQQETSPRNILYSVNDTKRALCTGVTVSLNNLKAQDPVSLGLAETDEYLPCSLNPDYSPDAVIIWVADYTETLRVDVCGNGGYQQVRHY